MLYLRATPPLEASDELWHFGLVDHIATTGQLPVQVAGVETPWEQEGSQPPLYYLIAAELIKPLDRSDFDAARQPNPHAIAGIPGAVGNKNLVLHPTPPKTALAVYLLRLFGLGCGMVTLRAVYLSARLLAPERPLVALLAAALTAFNPMFLFISASVNNDNLVIALGSLAIWQTLALLRYGFTTRRSADLALLIALAALTKLSGLALIPVVALAALWTAYQRRDWRGLIKLGGLVAGLWALLAGWWYVRNLTLYGELFGTATMAAVAGVRQDAFTLRTLLDEFQGFRFTYWGVFGAVNIMTYRPFYDILDGVTLLAVAGLLMRLARSRDRDERVRILLLGLLVATGAVSVIAWTSQTYASQGRLLFPYLAAISPLLALGLCAWIPANADRVVYVAALALAGCAATIPFASIAPAYAPPSPLSALPADAQPVFARFGDVALIGYQAPDTRYAPGESVPVTLYWQVLQNSPDDLSLYLHVVLDDGTTVGKVDTYPGAGSLRTTTWRPGAIYADRYAVPLDASGSPSRLRLQVGWWNYATGAQVDATDSAGNPLASVMLDAGAYALPTVGETLADAQPATADFGGLIRLVGYTLADDGNVALLWECVSAPPEDYTVFIQALDDAGQMVGQGDAAPPLPTHYWRPGERFVTRHTLTGMTDGARVIVGWYRPGDFQRLATAAPDNAYVLTP